MKVTVRYFGAIAEKVGKTEEELDLSEIGSDFQDFKNHCLSSYDIEDDGTLQIAINQELGLQRSLKEGDEIAFLPPFAGG